MKRDNSLATILWDGPEPPPEIIAKVRENIRVELVDLKTPSDLIFHTVWLDDTPYGPCVVLFPAKQEGAFVGVYEAGETEYEVMDVNSKAEFDGNRIRSVEIPLIVRRTLTGK